MYPRMEEVTLSAIMGELANRSMSFLINKWSDIIAPTQEEMVDSLQRLLLRVGAIVEEAEGRCITNQALLQQLNILRQELYKGYYTLDTFICQAYEGDKAKHHEDDHNFSVSRFNASKRLRICSAGRASTIQLKQVVGSLQSIIQDSSEFIMLTGRYSCLSRQPYNMYLFLDNCMFGRQMEMEHVLNFLLQKQAPGVDHLGVLPIIGPQNVGKSTLVEHACLDERVRMNFSQILFLNGDYFRREGILTLINGGVIKYSNPCSAGGRILIIVELDSDINEDLWQRLYSASRIQVARGSKIIITSRSSKVVSFGTTLPLRLQFLTQEAYWYFFKVRMFGNMDVMEYPKLASIAMYMASEMNGCFKIANIMGEMLRSNVNNTRLWTQALATYRNFKQKNPFMCKSAHQVDPWVHKPIFIPTANGASQQNFVVLDFYHTTPAQDLGASGHSDNAPAMMTVQDLMFGSACPSGKFDALAWRSHIPPHYSYFYKCELQNVF